MEAVVIKKGRNTRKTTKEFIEDAITIHGNKYSYHKVFYVNAKTPVVVVCSEHGDFNIRPNVHLNGSGCIHCGRRSSSRKRTKTTEQFIKEARAIHGDKYDYSKTEYLKDSERLVISCTLHGDFQQTANSHLNGKGCSLCGQETIVNKRRTKKNNFIKKSEKQHGKRYSYNNIPETFNVRDKVEIICEDHGVFEQVAYYHLNGNGCPSCSKSKGEIMIEEALEDLGITFVCQFKNREYSNLQTFDFFLPVLGVFIEYDGIHHYQPTRFSSSMSEEEAGLRFKKQKERDKEKDKWCEENDYPLIRIPYWHSKDEIKNTLKHLTHKNIVV